MRNQPVQLLHYRYLYVLSLLTFLNSNIYPVSLTLDSCTATLHCYTHCLQWKPITLHDFGLYKQHFTIYINLQILSSEIYWYLDSIYPIITTYLQELSSLIIYRLHTTSHMVMKTIHELFFTPETFININVCKKHSNPYRLL